MINIRKARDTDVAKIRDLFAEVYGRNYPYTGFYDTEWLKKAVYDDNVLFLVMEEEDKIIATASMMLSAGALDDMIGEAGRLVATTDQRYRGKGLYVELTQALIEQTKDRVQFLMGEARTTHRGSQRILEELGWAVVGFEPMKYRVAQRESMAFYAKLQGMAWELRRNNPRVIPEVALLAQTALKNMKLPADIIVVDEKEGYPTGQTFEIEHLQEQIGLSSLLRIERGRVTNREIFGNFSLSYGFFRMATSNTYYLVAREGKAVVGAIGFVHDPIDQKVRILEMIEFNDAVKGYLLVAAERIAREKLNAVYQEVDVSAYSPKIQRTLERLGFVPIAYCPSMVFSNVERLDVIRMAKISCEYELGTMHLLDSSKEMKEIVEKGFENCMLGMQITDSTRKADLFLNVPEGELYHLARIARLRELPKGTELVRQDTDPDNLFILVHGKAKVIKNGQVVGLLQAGNVFGEMALVEKIRRTATVVLDEDSQVIEIDIQRLEHLMENRPRLGYSITRNLARSLSLKLHT